MLFNKPASLAEMEKRLTLARNDLAEAEKRVETIAAAKDAAAQTADTFANWRTDHGEADLEVARLTHLVATLEPAVIERRSLEQVETIRKRAASVRKSNSALAERVRSEGAKLSGQLIALLKEVAASEVEAEQINSLLPDGDERVRSANDLARRREAVPRKVVSEKVERLWVYASNGNLIGDQDRVLSNGGDRGVLPSIAKYTSEPHTQCSLREFRVTKFHPEIAAQYPGSILDVFDLPNFDAPGSAIFKRWKRSPAIFAAEATATNVAAPREVETEIVPLKPWDDVPSGSGRGYQPLHNVSPVVI